MEPVEVVGGVGGLLGMAEVSKAVIAVELALVDLVPKVATGCSADKDDTPHTLVVTLQQS